MKRKILLILLITAMLMSMCITNGSAKELETLAEIAAYSKLEPVGTATEYQTFDSLAEVGASALPSSYSSKDLGYTTPVRYQSSNICWAYSSLSSLETLLLKSGHSVSHFSPQHMNIWGTMASDGTGWQREDLVNDGGYSYIPMGYFTSWGGPLYDHELPLEAGKTEYNNANKLYSSDYGITGIRYIGRETPIDTIKSYILKYGAVIANFNADSTNYMNAYSEAFYCGDSTLSSSQLYGHSVSLVGWDDNYKKENFSSSSSGHTPKKNGAWLMKNSWGTYVNDLDGYFWISYEDAWLFHSIFGPSFVITDYQNLDGSEYIYQNEIHGATTQFSYLTSENSNPAREVTYVNVYDFSEEHSVLDKVVFESTSYGADYTVYYIPVFGGKPTQETFLWKQLASGTINYTGYIPVDTNDFDLPAGAGAIGISIDNTNTYNENKNTSGYEYIPNSIGVCEWLAYKGGYYFKNQGKAGDSFLIYKENDVTRTTDVMDFYDKYFQDTMGCTFVIKAITENPDFIPDITPPDETVPEPTETTAPSDNKTLSLGVTLEYLGDTVLTVIAKASGGSGNFEYEFKLDGKVIQEYSELDYASTTLGEDGDYSLQISAKDTGSNKVIISQSVITVKDGKIQSSNQSLESSEPVTTNSSDINSYLIGDVDFSGEISIKDATLIRKYLAKMTEFDPLTLCVADVDSSEKCNIADATNVQKYLALIDTDTNVGRMAIIKY